MARRREKKREPSQANPTSLRLVTDTRLLEPSLHTIDSLTDLDAYVLCLPEDIRPLRGLAGYLDWRLCGRLSSLILLGGITGRAGERVLTPTSPGVAAARVFVFGWGPSTQILDGAAERFADVIDRLGRAKVKKCAIDLPWPGRPLLGLVDEHLKRPLGDRLVGVFEPEPEDGP